MAATRSASPFGEVGAHGPGPCARSTPKGGEMAADGGWLVLPGGGRHHPPTPNRSGLEEAGGRREEKEEKEKEEEDGPGRTHTTSHSGSGITQHNNGKNTKK